MRHTGETLAVLIFYHVQKKRVSIFFASSCMICTLHRIISKEKAAELDRRDDGFRSCVQEYLHLLRKRKRDGFPI